LVDTITRAAHLYESSGCDYKNGKLKKCAPLAASYIPMQQENPPMYSNNDGLTRGTLFPGLDLPFMNITNKSNPCAGTPLGELMALSFAVKELNLYLDTHPEDGEAFEVFKSLSQLLKAGKATYSATCGPIDVESVSNSNSYTWLNDPWPWEYVEKVVRK